MRLFSSFDKILSFLESAYEDPVTTFVSTQTPLLSNLSMLENIALISQVHEKLSITRSHKKAYEALSTLDLGRIASLRYENCSAKEKFYVQLLRANILKDAKVIIEQPFMLLAEEMSIEFILNALQRLNISYDRVSIIDLIHQQSNYKEPQCHIEK